MITDPVTGDHYRVLDVHQHLNVGEGTTPALPIEPRLQLLDRFGIDQAVLLPPSGAFGAEAVSADDLNAMTAAVVTDHPGRFACGVAHVDLAAGERAGRQVIGRAVTELGLRGVAWHHRFQGAYLDHPHMPGLLRQCADLGVPALIHVISESSLEAVWRLARLLAQCPETTVVALDGFSSSDQAGEMIDLADRYGNLYCDLGAMISVSGWTIRRFIDTVSADRLLFGTDLYMTPRTWHAPAPLYEVIHLDLPPAAKAGILAGNALRLFGIPGH